MTIEVLGPKSTAQHNFFKVSIDIKMSNPWPYKNHQYGSNYSVVTLQEHFIKNQSNMRCLVSEVQKPETGLKTGFQSGNYFSMKVGEFNGKFDGTIKFTIS